VKSLLESTRCNNTKAMLDRNPFLIARKTPMDFLKRPVYQIPPVPDERIDLCTQLLGDISESGLLGP